MSTDDPDPDLCGYKWASSIMSKLYFARISPVKFVSRVLFRLTITFSEKFTYNNITSMVGSLFMDETIVFPLNGGGFMDADPDNRRMKFKYMEGIWT